MSFTVITRQPISPGADLWSYTITGDPSSGDGLKAGIGSLARQSDSTPSGALWIKRGLLATEWESFAAGAGGSGGGGTTSSFVVSPEQYGAFANGVADSSLDEAAMAAAMLALKNSGGGTLELYHNYAITTATGVVFNGDGYSNITWRGRSPQAGFHSTANNAQANSANAALFFFSGVSAYGATNLSFFDFSMEGFSTSDYRRMMIFSHSDGTFFERVRIKNNALEGLYFNGANVCKNAHAIYCQADNIGLGIQYLSAYNLNADTMSLTFSRATNCGQGLEQQGRNFRIIGNHFEQCIFTGLLLVSTWASWLDQLDGVTVRTSNNGIVEGNIFIDMDTGIQTGDSAGHVDHGVPVPGNAGLLTIKNNNFLRVARTFSGGSDQFHKIIFSGNTLEDAFNATNAAIDCQKGWFIVEDNTIILGPNSQWGYIIKAGDRDPANTKVTLRNNKIYGKAWTTTAIVLGGQVEEIGTRFFDVSGTASYRGWASDLVANGLIGPAIAASDSWFVPDDSEFVYSPFQPTRMKVHGALPTKGTYKVGDRLQNIDGTSPWWDAMCTVGGTADTIHAGVTCTTTSGSVNFTITANLNYVLHNQYITIAGVTGTKKIVTYEPTTGVGTFDTTASASVTSAAVAYSAPTWTTR